MREREREGGMHTEREREHKKRKKNSMEVMIGGRDVKSVIYTSIQLSRDDHNSAEKDDENPKRTSSVSSTCH